MRLNKPLFMIAILLTALVNIHSQDATKTKAKANQNATEIDKNKALKLLLELPDWYRNRTAENKSKYLSIAASISKFDSESIKRAESEYVHSLEVERDIRLDRMINLLIFQKIFFKVPSKYLPYKEFFAGFGYYPDPEKDGKMNWLLPLTENEKGELELTGGIIFQRGNYRVFEEFEYFEKEFGRRKVFK